MYRGKRWQAVRPQAGNGWYAVIPEGVEYSNLNEVAMCFGGSAAQDAEAIAEALNLLPGDESIEEIDYDAIAEQQTRSFGRGLVEIGAALALIGFLVWMATVILPHLR